jgi:uncharacterized coiled-coil protein SlyX
MFWCKCESIIENYIEGFVRDRSASLIEVERCEDKMQALESKFKDFEKACQTMISREQNLLQTLSERVAKLERSSRMYVRKKGRPYRLMVNKEINE